MRSPLEIGTRSRNSIWGAFLVMGMVSMGWVPRIPEIKDANGLSNGQFGLVLLASSLGSVAGAQLSGRLVHSFGSRAVARIAGFVMPVGLIGMGLSTNPIMLVITLFVMGFGYASMDICLNTQGVAVEKILGRRWMSSFHAMWSTGAFLITVIGGVIARHVSPSVNLVAIGAICVAAFVPAVASLLPPELDGHSGGEEDTQAKIPLFSRSTFPLWGIGFGLLGCLIAEGAASDWGAILLRDHMGVGKGINASAFASFALAMITSRFLGDKALDHFGPARLVKLGGYIGAVGWGASIAIAIPLSPTHPLIALIIINFGFILAGLGIGPMFPAFILAASATPGIAPSVAIARVGVIGITGYFLGPSLTGALAELFSLPVAMFYPVAMLLVAGYLSHTIKSEKK